MNCTTLNEHLDDFIDNNLAADTRGAFEQHVATCAGCRKIVSDARRLQAMLKEYGESDVAGTAPDTAFFDRALAAAAHTGARRERRRYWVKGFGSAMAAGLALFAVTLLFLRSPEPHGVPGVTMALEEPQTVNLVFASASELVDATLTVVLPDGIDVAGFEGQREISWVTTLREGRNVLPLRLIATSPRGGELLATLQHEDDDRTFRLQVTVI